MTCSRQIFFKIFGDGLGFPQLYGSLSLAFQLQPQNIVLDLGGQFLDRLCLAAVQGDSQIYQRTKLADQFRIGLLQNIGVFARGLLGLIFFVLKEAVMAHSRISRWVKPSMREFAIM